MEDLFEKLERPSGSHKGENGKVLVIGGSRKYTGAPALAAEAALRAGTDLVKILTAEEAKPVVQGFSKNLIVESYGESFDDSSLDKALGLERWADTTVIGPGLSDFDEDAVKELAGEAENLVIDTGAIEVLKDTSGNIFTPHSGEAEILNNEYGSIQDFARDTSSTVLVKGEVDEIYASDDLFENESGCAGMTVGGTGDVLSGVVAGFRSQGLEAAEACRLGAYVNGKAGEKAFDEYGRGLLATDVVDRIPEVIIEN